MYGIPRIAPRSRNDRIGCSFSGLAPMRKTTKSPSILAPRLPWFTTLPMVGVCAGATPGARAVRDTRSVVARVALATDIGEGLGPWRLGDDDALLEIVTSANIACGFHAGDPVIMRRTCAASVANGVAIGAQVSYRDLHGFGR